MCGDRGTLGVGDTGGLGASWCGHDEGKHRQAEHGEKVSAVSQQPSVAREGLMADGSKRQSPLGRTKAGFEVEAGTGLLSHGLATAVPYALTGLTSGFAMGTRVTQSRVSAADTKPSSSDK